MSKRRVSESATVTVTEPFELRWHSIANQETPSADIMSSPDPLNDSAHEIAPPPSSRRVTRSQRSDRFVALSASPRKQTFELEYGDNTSPHKLFVTVETDNLNTSGGPRRRLFPSPSPFPAARPGGASATTTTVPLNDSIEDDPEHVAVARIGTPRRRGRPRKSNGTPLPSGAKKRKAGTPIKRTPKPRAGSMASSAGRPDPLSDPIEEATPKTKRRGRPPTPRIVDLLPDPLDDNSRDLSPTPTPKPKRRRPSPSKKPDATADTSAQATPKSTGRRGRPPKKRVTEPSSELGTESVSKVNSSRTGRRRRQALIPEELVEMADEVAEAASIVMSDAAPEDDMELIRAPPESPAEKPAPDLPEAAADDADADLWMATLSDQATPRTATRTVASAPAPQIQAATRSPSLDVASIASYAEDHADGFGDGAPSASEGSSPVQVSHEAAPKSDTIAQGEDFSMIFMDSIPSMQPELFKSSIPIVAQSDMGEETSLIINNTLESLRQSLRQGSTADSAQGPVGQDVHNQDNQDDEDDMFLIEAEEAPQDHTDTPQTAGDQGLSLEDDIMEEQVYSRMALAEQPQEEDQHVAQERILDEVLLEALGQEPAHEEIGQEQSSSKGSVRSFKNIRSSPVIQQDEPDELASEETTSVKASSALSPSRAWSPRLARSPQKANISPLRRKVLKLKAKQMDSASHLADTEDDAPLPQLGRSPRSRFSERIQIEDDDEYEDSFSEIPQVVLEAATPGRAKAVSRVPIVTIEDDDDGEDMLLIDESEEEQEEIRPDVLEKLPEEQATEQPDVHFEDQPEHQPPAQEDITSESSPQPPAIARPQPTVSSNASSVAPADNGRLPTPDDTPPVNESDDAGSPDKTAVDVIVPSSPSYHDQLQIEQEAASSVSPAINKPTPRTTVSEDGAASVMEATPVNQLSSPAQEPQSLAAESVQDKAARPALSAILRAGRALQSVTSDPPSPDSRDNQLRSPFRSSASKDSGSREPPQRARISISPGLAVSVHQRRSVPRDRPVEGSFTMESNELAQPDSSENLRQSVAAPVNRPRAPSLGSAASSMRVTPPDEEMSWVANAGPISPKLRGDNSLADVARASGASAANKMPPAIQNTIEDEDEASDVDIQAQPQPDNRKSSPEQDNDADIWEFEAERSEPRSTRQQPFGNKSVALPPRRGAIPSPWKRRSRQADPRPNERRVENASATSAQKTAPGNVEALDEEFSLLAQRDGVQEAVKPQQRQESASKAGGFDLSSFFSSPAAIPGKIAEKLIQFTSGGPSKQPASVLQPEVSGNATIMPTSSMFPQITQKRPEPPEGIGRELFAPSSVRLTQPSSAAEKDRSSSPETPERIEVPTVSQKKNFTPRSRQTSQTFLQPTQTRSATTTPPRMQLSHADIQRWQQETSNASEESPEFIRPLLRPLPPKNASPNKSSLRSPMKPHTPGRVVEFTSSVLSPMEQVKAREQQRRLSIASNSLAEITQPDTNVQPPVRTDDKENHDSDVSMTDASPLAKSPAPEPLSKTTWSRQHWLLLDRILQRRRQGPFELQFERCADKYLGKTVKSQGEGMKLERWHLDCVDAFKGVVGGWDEAVLAKRLFALISGEQKRKRGSAKAKPSVMFH